MRRLLIFFPVILAILGYYASCRGGESLDSGNDLNIRGGTDSWSNNTRVSQSTVGLGSTRRSSIWCSGTLIAQNWVVTAAHCFMHGNPTHVYFGTQGPSRKVVGQPIKHERFNANNMFDFAATADAFDIALVKIAGGAPTGYRPIRVAGNDTSIGPGEQLTVAGFGEKHSSADMVGLLRYTTMRCTVCRTNALHMNLQSTPGNGACPGDSGGPAFKKSGRDSANGIYALVGVLHRGTCSVGNASYLNVRRFKNWMYCQAGFSFDTQRRLSPAERYRACVNDSTTP